jgi:predicted permease
MRIAIMLRRRFRALFRRADVEQELDEVLRLHFDLDASSLERSGLSPADARRLAVARNGGIEPAKESVRDARGTRPLEELGRDVRYAFRTLAAAPAFTIAVVATLAIGIGATTAVFSVVNGVLLRALPYPNADRIAVIWETDSNSGTTREPGSLADYFDYAASTHAFTNIAGFKESTPTLVADDAIQVNAASVTHDMFDVLGVQPRLGRAFTAAEDAPGAAGVVELTDRFWRDRFGSDASIVGRTIRLDDSLYTVIGVLPADVRQPSENTDLWISARFIKAGAIRSNHSVGMLGRLRGGVTLEGAQRETDAIARRLEAEYPRDNTARGVHLEQLDDALVGSVRRSLATLFAGVALVLLIACTNAVNLLFARHAARTHEVAVRLALGASRRRLAQQFAVEGLVVSVAGAALGVLLAALALHVLPSIAPANLPRREDIALSLPVYGFALLVCLGIATAFGLLPVVQHRGADVVDAMHSRGTAGSHGHQRLRRMLIVGEVAVALVLAAAASLVLRSFDNVLAVNLGFNADHLFEVHYTLPQSRYPQDYSKFPAGWTQMLSYQRNLEAGARGLAGVRSTALAATDPLDPGFTNSFVIVGREAEAQRGQAELTTRPVSATYFETVGVPLVRGRLFTDRDDASAPLVVVINQAAANKYFAGRDPIGQRIRFWGQPREIVGVVGNERFGGLTADAPPAVYPPIMQAPMSTATLLVRTTGDARDVPARVRQVMRQIDPLVAPFGARMVDDAVNDATSPQRFIASLLGGFATIALLLALIGIHGVISYNVLQRRREIGLRVALGATRGAVIRAVLGQALGLAAIGIAIGAVGALAAGRLLSSQLFGVSPGDPLALGAAVLSVVAIALVGAAWPARRATAVSPMLALRGD